MDREAQKTRLCISCNSRWTVHIWIFTKWHCRMSNSQMYVL